MYKIVVTFINKEAELQYIECDHMLFNAKNRSYSIVRGMNIYGVSVGDFAIYSVMDKDDFFKYMRFIFDAGAENRYKEMNLDSPKSIQDRLLTMWGETEQSDTK